MGEPSGIGPELCLRAAADRGLRRKTRMVLVGNTAVFHKTAKNLGLALPPAHKLTPSIGKLRFPFTHSSGTSLRFRFGKPSPATGREAARAIEAAVSLCLEGPARALVTAPVDKQALQLGGCPYPGHTGYLEALTKSKKTMMLFCGKTLRVALHSIHVPLRQALCLITRDRLIENIAFVSKEHRRLFGKTPKILVAGLNPHAGEGGLMGSEEKEIIGPAVLSLRRRGVKVSGPFAPDTVFQRALNGEGDLVYALTHDHGLIGIKTAEMFSSVNVTLGLPFVRTSPDHGVAYDLAGTGKADMGGMQAAVRLASELTRPR